MHNVYQCILGLIRYYHLKMYLGMQKIRMDSSVSLSTVTPSSRLYTELATPGFGLGVGAIQKVLIH